MKCVAGDKRRPTSSNYGQYVEDKTTEKKVILRISNVVFPVYLSTIINIIIIVVVVVVVIIIIKIVIIINIINIIIIFLFIFFYIKSYLQLIRLKKEKTIHSKTLFTIPVELKST